MLTKPAVQIILQYIHVSDHGKLIQSHMSIVSQLETLRTLREIILKHTSPVFPNIPSVRIMTLFIL